MPLQQQDPGPLLKIHRIDHFLATTAQAATLAPRVFEFRIRGRRRASPRLGAAGWRAQEDIAQQDVARGDLRGT
jgi:hypothetical protein